MVFLGLTGDSKREIKICAMEIEHEKVFHVKHLYERIYHWLKDEGYTDVYEDRDIYETLYLDRTMPNGLKEYVIWWRAHKDPRGGQYFKFFLTIGYRGLAISKKDIVVDGKKHGTNAGDMIIRIEAYLLIDYRKQWENHWLLRYFDDNFRLRWFRKEIETKKDDLYKEAYKLHNAIKQYLDLTLPKRPDEPYWRNKGL